jgi:threonyl-tRNA synthetase
LAKEKIENIRHSLAHLLAAAVLELWPDAKPTIGPVIENGFYYDFDFDHGNTEKKHGNTEKNTGITEKDLPRIEEKMRKILKTWDKFEEIEETKESARKRYKGNPYKEELIEELIKNGEKITSYKSGNFIDLCRGGHVKSAKNIDPESFKLTSIAGAYWRGSEKNKMLTRIYGVAFENKKELETYLWQLEEAKKRDHRTLGKELDLFSISDEIGAGLILWHPKGAMMRVIIEDFSRHEHLKNGYEWVFSPHIGRGQLWKTSGHLGFYRENMYSPMNIEGEDYYIKPMNCPFHIQIYKSHIRSYRDLPKRYAEFGTVYRYELSGVLHGLTRVRGFTQDDAHIFCHPDQVETEIGKALNFSLFILKSFGLRDFKAYVSTRPEKYVGSSEDWEMATAVLKQAVKAENLDFEIDEGGGAFYGPKIDLKVEDALGRQWQLSTIQFDFNLPERFGLEYIDEKGKPRKPFMVHRALFGSFERFLGVLIEHYGGAFPLWLSPIQVAVIPIGSKHLKYAKEVCEKLRNENIRVELYDKNETISKKIREAEMQKIPYVAVVGDKELKLQAVAIRKRGEGDKGQAKVEDFIDQLKKEISRKI